MSAPLSAAQAHAAVVAWAAGRKRGARGWGVVWDPLANQNPAYGHGGPCQVVYEHDGGSYKVKSWGDTWEVALHGARIPNPNDRPAPDPGLPPMIPQPGSPA